MSGQVAKTSKTLSWACNKRVNVNPPPSPRLIQRILLEKGFVC